MHAKDRPAQPQTERWRLLLDVEQGSICPPDRDVPATRRETRHDSRCVECRSYVQIHCGHVIPHQLDGTDTLQT